MSWKGEEVVALKELMADEIDQKKSVTMEAFRNKMKDNPVLKEANSKNASDRVRSEWHLERKSNCKHEEEEDGRPPSGPPIQKDTFREKESYCFICHDFM